MSKKEKVETPKTVTFVYCGPTIPHICTRFAMFSVVPRALEEKAKELPIIRNLIIPISDFAKVRAQLDRGEGPVTAIYREIQKHI